MPRMRFAARPVLGCWALLCLWLACAGGPAWAATFGELKGRFEQEKEKDFNTRYATVREIGALGTLEALRFLERVSVEDADASIRSNSLFVMAQVPLPEAAEALVKAFQEREKERNTILSAWTSYRKDALPASIVDEVLSRTDVGMRSSIVRYLGTQQDARFLPEARRFLSQFPGQATSITSALVAQPSPESAQLLLEVYDDERVYDRDTVAPFFAAGKPEVRAVLVQAIGAGREPLLTRAAVLAARAKVAECEEVLVHAADAAKDDRRAALLFEAAGKVGLASERGRALALSWLGSDVEVRALAAARALRAQPVVEAVSPLIALLDAKSVTLRVEARITLERATGQQFGERIDLWEAWWSKAQPTFDATQVKPPEAGALDQALIHLALEKGAAALKAVMAKEPAKGKGPWEYGGHPVGTTALVLLALHASGSDAKDRVFMAGLRWLLEQPVPDTTYDAGLVAMTLETIGGKRHKLKITEAARLLIASQNEAGFWGYPSGNGDHSNSQYAILGLRHAARAGVSISDRVWKDALEHWLATQNEDGGWSYVPQSKRDTSASSMTAAGVSSLLICLENGTFDAAARTTAEAALDRGFTALGTLMNLGKDGLYALYGIERAAVLGRRASMAGKPWYGPGAQRILDEQGADGLWTGSYARPVDAAFAILFLKKATTPIAPVVTR